MNDNEFDYNIYIKEKFKFKNCCINVFSYKNVFVQKHLSNYNLRVFPKTSFDLKIKKEITRVETLMKLYTIYNV